MKNKLFVIILFIIGAAAGYFIFDHQSKSSIDSYPVPFSHYVHTSQHKIKCVNCHRGVETDARAGIPNIDYCSMCHSTLINPSSKREKIIYDLVKENKPIIWKVHYTVPDYVYFSHRRHVKLGKLECTECHGDMTKQDSPDLKNYSPIMMPFCFNCHEQKDITTDCGNCHH
ncbi:MAG: cytochrome c family protein [Bacteroidetes bacterium]|nr:cytochrome c family protein [Bacteroidota bacterium]